MGWGGTGTKQARNEASKKPCKGRQIPIDGARQQATLQSNPTILDSVSLVQAAGQAPVAAVASLTDRARVEKRFQVSARAMLNLVKSYRAP